MDRRSRWSAPRYAAALILAAVIVGFPGCRRKGAEEPAAAPAPPPAAAPAAPQGGAEGATNVEGAPAKVEGQAAAFDTAEVLSDASSAFSLLEGLEIGTLSGSTLTAQAKLQLGQALTLTGARGQATIDGQRHEVLKARTESGLEGYVASSYIAKKAGLAVVIAQSAAVYTKPQEGAASRDRLPSATVVAAGVDTMGEAFPSVSLVDPATRRAYQGVYMRQVDLSFRKDDVGSAILMARAATATDEAEELTLLRQAASDFPSSHFVVRIEERIAELSSAVQPAPAAAEERESEPFFASLLTTADGVNVRSSPDEKAGKILSTLAKGKEVEVEAKTTSDYTIGDQTAPWYRIREPAGWVFGAYVGWE